MSKNTHTRNMDLHAEQKKKAAGAKKIDRRILRTRDRLGDALIELIQEKPFDQVTVQEVLDRAGVGRSTFYLHYRDKDDLFLSDVEEFLEAIATALARCKDKSDRVAPIAEFFGHVAEAQKLYRALVESGRIHDFLDLARGHFARGIEQRLRQSSRAQSLTAAERSARAHALAGNLISLLQWWLDRGAKESPQQMDEMFHAMVWKGIV